MLKWKKKNGKIRSKDGDSEFQIVNFDGVYRLKFRTEAGPWGDWIDNSDGNLKGLKRLAEGLNLSIKKGYCRAEQGCYNLACRDFEANDV